MYTPGPWAVELGARGNIIIGAPKPGDDTRFLWIAEIADHPGAREEANARLIAQAPALLEALETCPALHSAAWAHFHPIRSEDAFTKEMYQWIEQARAAIKAATE